MDGMGNIIPLAVFTRQRQVSLLQQLATQLARPAFHGPLRRFLRRWLQRQRMKAAVKAP